MADQNPFCDELDSPYTLTDEQVTRFRREGFIKLKRVFTGPLLAHFTKPISRWTQQLDKHKDVPMQDRTTYAKAFVQVANLWQRDDQVRQLSFSKRLARLAGELLGVDGVRMWHDQALCKEPGGGITPWHADQQYWPMATEHCLTAWIPLQATPTEMGPLAFLPGSHVSDVGRDLPISDHSETEIARLVSENHMEQFSEPFELGEVSFHYGWTLHRAGPNSSDQPRRVHTVIYMDKDMRLAEPANDNQRTDWQAWTPSTRIGQVMADERNPVLY